LEKTLFSALKLREALFKSKETDAYRLINGEGDSLPGLIVDKYGPYLVVQVGALGMRKLLPWFLERLKKHLSPVGIYEKSTGSSLKEEGMEPCEQVLVGEIPDRVQILEEGIRFKVDIKKGQKTGFFLDHREMRKVAADLAKGARVLNAFCYTGGFTLAALKGGATHVDSVDVSESALKLCKENVSLNGFKAENHGFYQEDVFEFLQTNPLDYDLVILDPPAFAKKKNDLQAACKGYQQIFRLAIEKMPSNSFLIVSSCSYHVSPDLFQKIVFQSTTQAKRPVRIIGAHRLAFDHPVNLFHPESAYLKSLVLALF